MVTKAAYAAAEMLRGGSLHLSQHPRARDVMTQVHWANNNHFIHYGGAGLDMFRVLGYDALRDDRYTGQGALAFEFDDVANDASVSMLTEQLVRLIREHEAIRFGDLYACTCNTTPADTSRYRLALEDLIGHKEIIVNGPKGASRRKATTIEDDDLIKIASQRTLFVR